MLSSFLLWLFIFFQDFLKKRHPKTALGARSTARGGDTLVGRAENTRSEMFSAAVLLNSLEADNFQENQINSEVDCRTRRDVSFPARQGHPSLSAIQKRKLKIASIHFWIPASSAPPIACSPTCCSKLLHADLQGSLWRCCNQCTRQVEVRSRWRG